MSVLCVCVRLLLAHKKGFWLHQCSVVCLCSVVRACLLPFVKSDNRWRLVFLVFLGHNSCGLMYAVFFCVERCVGLHFFSCRVRFRVFLLF